MIRTSPCQGYVSEHATVFRTLLQCRIRCDEAERSLANV